MSTRCFFPVHSLCPFEGFPCAYIQLSRCSMSARRIFPINHFHQWYDAIVLPAVRGQIYRNRQSQQKRRTFYRHEHVLPCAFMSLRLSTMQYYHDQKINANCSFLAFLAVSGGMVITFFGLFKPFLGECDTSTHHNSITIPSQFINS